MDDNPAITPVIGAPLTIDDILAGAYTILGEARNENYQGQLAIAYVIVNRLNRPTYFKKTTIWDVCHAPLQFSMWNNSPDINLEATLGIKVFDFKFLIAVKALLVAITEPENDPTNGADHYHTYEKPSYASYWPPSWADHKKLTKVLGSHVFYNLGGK